jgi:hypothetical protein
MSLVLGLECSPNTGNNAIRFHYSKIKKKQIITKYIISHFSSFLSPNKIQWFVKTLIFMRKGDIRD